MDPTTTIAIVFLAIIGTIAAIRLIPWALVARTAAALILMILIVFTATHLHLDAYAVLETLVPDFGGTTP